MEVFRFERPTEEFVELQLSNTERALLRQQVVETGILPRVQAAMVDYARRLEQRLVGADLISPEGIRLAQKLQSEIQSVRWHAEFWESVLTDTEEEDKS
jgi:hypothetical protein